MKSKNAKKFLRNREEEKREIELNFLLVFSKEMPMTNMVLIVQGKDELRITYG